MGRLLSEEGSTPRPTRPRRAPRPRRLAALAAALAPALVAVAAAAPAVPGTAAAPATPFIVLVPALGSPGTDPGAAVAGVALADLYAPLLLPAGREDGASYQWQPGQVPELARSIAHHAGTYTIDLRSGVRACDGDVLTASDVAGSITRALQPAADEPATAAAYQAAGIVAPTLPGGQGVTPSVTVTGPLTVAVRPASDDGLLPAVLATPASAPIDLAVLRRHSTASDPLAARWLAAHDAGFGPYCLSSYGSGKEVLTANPYWQVAPVPRLESVVLEAVPSAATRLERVQSGVAEVAEDLTPALYAAAAPAAPAGSGTRRRAVVVQEDLTTSHLQLDLNYATAPWGPNGSPRALLLRRAVAAALPYGAIRSLALGPAGLAWEGEVPPAIPGSLRDAGLFSTDPALATADLAAAGYPGGQGLPSAGLVLAYDAGDSVEQAAAGTIATALSSVGINVSPQAVPAAEYATAANTYPMSLQTGGETYLSATWYTKRWYLAASLGGAIDASGYDDPDLNALALEAEHASGAEALRLAAAEQAIELQDLPVIPLAVEAARAVVAPDVRGMAVGGIGPLFAVTSTVSGSRQGFSSS